MLAPRGGGRQALPALQVVLGQKAEGLLADPGGGKGFADPLKRLQIPAGAGSLEALVPLFPALEGSEIVSSRPGLSTPSRSSPRWWRSAVNGQRRNSL